MVTDFWVVVEDGEEHLVRPELNDPTRPAQRLSPDGHPYCADPACPLTFPYHFHVR